jgi:EmrB/QacA subfamily drug resistance transporter
VTIALRPPCDRGVIESRRSPGGCPKFAANWVLAVTIIASGMTFIDGTVVNVALPALQADFRTTFTQVQWVVESYALVLSALILVGGALGDRLGRRRVFAAGVALFGAGSLWCGLARGATELIIARGVQGVGAALLVPGSLAIISAEFDERDRGRAIGTWSAATAILAAVGPVIGGWVIETFSWRGIFFVNLPLCAAVLLVLFRYVRESRDPDATGPLDWLGTALVTVGLGGLVFGFLAVPQLGFAAPGVRAPLAVGALALVAFGIAETAQSHPMVPPRLFRVRTFSGANLLTFLLYAALSGALFFVPFLLIQLRGYSAMAAGAALLPFILIVFALSRWSGGLADRHGARRFLIAGPLVAGAGFGLLTLAGNAGSYWTTCFPGVVVLGLGMAISVAPLTTTVMSAADSSLAGTASGINNAVARTGGVLAVAVLGVVVFGRFHAELAERVARVSAAPSARAFVVDAGARIAAARIPDDLPAQVARALRDAVDVSFTSAFRLAMLVAAALAVAAAASGAMLVDAGGAAGAVARQRDAETGTRS